MELTSNAQQTLHRSSTGTNAATRESRLREQLQLDSQREVPPTNNATTTSNARRTCCHAPNIPWQHQILLTPYEKFAYYRILPCKAVLHVCLCIVAFLHVWLNVEVDVEYYQSTKSMFCRRVMPPGTDCQYGNNVFSDNTIGLPIYTQQEFLGSMQTALDGVCNNLNAGVDVFYPTLPKGGDTNRTSLPADYTVSLEWSKIQGNQMSDIDLTATLQGYDAKVQTSVTDVQCDGTGSPFDGARTLPQELRANVLATERVALKGTFGSYEYTGSMEEYMQCIVWNFEVVWDFSSRGMMILTNNIVLVGPCNKNEQDFSVRQNNIFDLLLLVLSFLVFVLNMRSIVLRIQLAQSVRAQLLLERASIGIDNNAPPPISKTLDCCVRLRVFVPVYFLTLAIGCFVLFVVSALNILSGFSQAPTIGIDKFCFGFAMMLIFYNLKRYLVTSIGKQGDQNTSVLFIVLSKAAPRVMYFLVSILPIMFGYVLCGTIWFGGRVRLFATCAQTLATLYSLANGDSIVPVLEAVSWADGWLGYIYLYTYISLVIFVIVNVFLVIVQQTYEDVVRRQEEEEGVENDMGGGEEVDGGREGRREGQEEQETKAGEKKTNAASKTVHVSVVHVPGDNGSRARARSCVIPPLPRQFGEKESVRIARNGTEFDDMLKYINR